MLFGCSASDGGIGFLVHRPSSLGGGRKALDDRLVWVAHDPWANQFEAFGRDADPRERVGGPVVGLRLRIAAGVVVVSDRKELGDVAGSFASV